MNGDTLGQQLLDLSIEERRSLQPVFEYLSKSDSRFDASTLMSLITEKQHKKLGGWLFEKMVSEGACADGEEPFTSFQLQTSQGSCYVMARSSWFSQWISMLGLTS